MNDAEHPCTPRDVDMVDATPAVTLRPDAIDERESRVGEVRVEHFADERPRRIVIAITEKELQVAEYSGLLIEHPHQDAAIHLGPFVHGKHLGDRVYGCVATVYTRPRLEAGRKVTYTHDESPDTLFELQDMHDDEQSRTDAHDGEQDGENDDDALTAQLRAAQAAGAHDEFVTFVADHPDSPIAETLDTAISLNALDEFRSVAGSFGGSLWEHGLDGCGNPDMANGERIRETFDEDRWPTAVKMGEHA